MYKKGMLIGLLSILFFTTGCEFTTGKIEDNKESKETTESTVEEKQDTFKKGKLTTEDFEIQITETAIVPSSHDEDEKVIVFTYEFTNLGKNALKPNEYFARSFAASQEFEDTIEELSVSVPKYGSFYNELHKAGLVKVKTGKTITTVATYKLKSEENMVLLTAYSSKNEREIGQKKFIPSIKKSTDASEF